MANDAASLPSTTTRTVLGTRVLVALGAVWFIWGSTYLAIRIAVGSLPPLVLSGLRYVVAGSALLAWVVATGEWSRNKPDLRGFRNAALLGVALISIGNGTMSWLGSMVPSGVLALLTCFTPVFMVVGDRLVTRVPMGWKRALGLGLGLVGSLWLVAPGKELRIAPGPLAVLLFASLSWTAASLWSRTAELPKSHLVTNTIEMLVGGLVTLALATATGEWGAFHPAQVTSGAWVSFAYLVVFGSIVAFTAYTWLLKQVPVHVVATHQYVNPVVAVALGAFVAGESMEPALLGAGALVVGASAPMFAPRRK